LFNEKYIDPQKKDFMLLIMFSQLKLPKHNNIDINVEQLSELGAKS
jgi:hypothetical protein